MFKHQLKVWILEQGLVPLDADRAFPPWRLCGIFWCKMNTSDPCQVHIPSDLLKVARPGHETPGPWRRASEPGWTAATWYFVYIVYLFVGVLYIFGYRFIHFCNVFAKLLICCANVVGGIVKTNCKVLPSNARFTSGATFSRRNTSTGQPAPVA